MAVKTGSIFDNPNFLSVAQPVNTASTATASMPYATKFGQSISDNPQFQSVAQPVNVAPELQAIQQIQQPQLQQPQYQMPNIQAPSKGGYDSAAGDYINPIINNQITQLQNALNGSLTNYENQKTGINQQASESVVSANQNNQVNKNNYNNETLSRGLGRSTIATTGTAGIDNTNNRILANIEKIRTGTLGNIDAQKTTAQNAFESSKAGLESDRQSMIKSKADELYDKDYSKYMQQVQMAQNAANTSWEQDYKTTQANQSQTNWKAEYEQKVKDSEFDKQLAKDKLELEAIQTNYAVNKPYSSGSGSGSKSSAGVGSGNYSINLGGTPYNFKSKTSQTDANQFVQMMNSTNNQYALANNAKASYESVKNLQDADSLILKVIYGTAYNDMVKAIENLDKQAKTAPKSRAELVGGY